jgi:hypothetical protein
MIKYYELSDFNRIFHSSAHTAGYLAGEIVNKFNRVSKKEVESLQADPDLWNGHKDSAVPVITGLAFLASMVIPGVQTLHVLASSLMAVSFMTDLAGLSTGKSLGAVTSGYQRARSQKHSISKNS